MGICAQCTNLGLSHARSHMEHRVAVGGLRAAMVWRAGDPATAYGLLEVRRLLVTVAHVPHKRDHLRLAIGRRLNQ